MGRVEVSFDRSWETREESHYNHWVRGVPANQIQFAFRRHWLTFQRYLPGLPGKEILEVGCGRGTISSYFADAGYAVTLLDSSPAVIDIGRIQRPVEAIYDMSIDNPQPLIPRRFNTSFRPARSRSPSRFSSFCTAPVFKISSAATPAAATSGVAL